MSYLRAVIHALIEKNPECSGYEIAKFLQDKTGNSHQQVYRELKTLECSGVVSSVEVPIIGRPNKFIYTINTKAVAVGFKDTDFTKTAKSYEVLFDDIICGSTNHAAYLHAMKLAEENFINGL